MFGYLKHILNFATIAQAPKTPNSYQTWAEYWHLHARTIFEVVVHVTLHELISLAPISEDPNATCPHFRKNRIYRAVRQHGETFRTEYPDFGFKEILDMPVTALW